MPRGGWVFVGAGVRQQVIEGLQFERRMLLSMAVIGGAFGALAAGLTTQAARWLWDTFLAVLSSGWATLAGWWNALLKAGNQTDKHRGGQMNEQKFT